MLYLNLDWIKGNINDSEYALRQRRYEAYLAGLHKNMHTLERIFAGINFNDALLLPKKQINEKLYLKFYIGDLQNGYYELKCVMSSDQRCDAASGEIITSEIFYENGNYRLSFILTCLKEYAVNFSRIDSLKFNAISEKKYHFEHKKFKLL